jgi:diguanylate cyclase (GGDEF)-like protein
VPYIAHIRATAKSHLTARPPEAVVLGLLMLGATLSLALGILRPISDQAPVVLGAAMSPVALGIAVVSIVYGNRLPRWAFPLMAALAVVLNSVLVARAATNGGAMVDALAFVWLTVYVAIFFPAVAMPFTGLAAGGFGTGLLVGGLPNMLTPWLITALSLLVASFVLVRLSRQVRRLVEHDTLTGSLNRAALMAAAEREIGAARRRGEDLAVVAADLDDFKLVNDRWGHATGDRLLTEVTAAWRATLRAQDVLGRMGGDEFVLLLPDTDQRGAAEAVERMRAAHDVRWSAGIAVWRAGETFEALLERADSRLYEAKPAARAAA